MNLGPVILDIAGLTLDDNDRLRLKHPQVGGVILFSRNYESPSQLKALVDDIHQLRNPPLIVSVDQEGGRVQRFRQGFQAIPAMSSLGRLYDQDPKRAIDLSETFAWIMSAELLYYGIDISFSPVLDIANPISQVVGDRAFHQHPEAVCRLASAWVRGMRESGMAAVGKHFPGHGSVPGDSHHVIPVDQRSFEQIETLDLVPFRWVSATHLSGIMMAHVIYDQIDTVAAGYSHRWINDILRQQLGFAGIVFSDDLSMSAAGSGGDYTERARMALQAGCDMLLVCNHPDGVGEILESLENYNNPVTQMRLVRLHGRPAADIVDLFNTHNWRQAIRLLNEFNQSIHSSQNDGGFELCFH